MKSQNTMQLTVKFFASLREQMGMETITVEIAQGQTMADVWQQVTRQPEPENLLCSRNLQYAEWDEKVDEGDEIGFFPPVTGG